MNIVRFSAVEMFGMPIDKPEDSDMSETLKLMGAYGIAAHEVSEELINITPYYWTSNNFQYFLSREEADGPVTVDMIETQENVVADKLMGIAGVMIFTPNAKGRAVIIPGEAKGFSLVGKSPRFAGQLCIHELITVI